MTAIGVLGYVLIGFGLVFLGWMLGYTEGRNDKREEILNLK